jgi:hypothetical protein
VLLTRCTDGSSNAATLQKFPEWNQAQQSALLLENEYTDTAKVGYPARRWDGEGTNMTVDKGNKLVRVGLDNSSGGKLATDPRLDSGSQQRIGDQLRAMYDELMQQPVPDRFKELLAQLDNKDGGKEGSQ